MRAIEIARRLAELGQNEQACQAYTLYLHQNNGEDPANQLEAALFLLQMGGNYKIAYTAFQNLYARGEFREECFGIMTQAFYEPNEKKLKKQYEKNCKLLSKYPYLFRKDFPDFEELTIHFYPYDDKGYLPFDCETEQFGEYINFKYPVVSRNFFKNLENPILASDVYSQYELEYLNDNVRKSEWAARENHIYLHYTDWNVFCAHLQVLNMRPLLDEKKIVFLIGEEVSQYPIDFKERFGIDYETYDVKPFSVREIQRMIWHTQLATHNGGDFFNEIFDNHPNLIYFPSMLLSNVEEGIQTCKKALENCNGIGEVLSTFRRWRYPYMAEELYRLPNRTDKDILVALYFNEDDDFSANLDWNSRIAPAMFFQPHFLNIHYELYVGDNDRTVLRSAQENKIRNSVIFKNFKYIKTFTPMRRITTSHSATVRFMYAMSNRSMPEGEKNENVVNDAVTHRLMNRSFMIDPENRLYQDSVLVRFEDGKLNPKATFTALAAFVDLPYTESMTYCSEAGVELNSAMGRVGFDTAPVYRTYDEYANDAERYYIEYFMRDVYEYYGYDFHYYDGAPVDEERVKELITNFTTINRYIRETWGNNVFSRAEIAADHKRLEEETEKRVQEKLLENYMERLDIQRLDNAKILMRGLYFVNDRGQPLRMMPMLKLDPDLLEQPLYH